MVVQEYGSRWAVVALVGLLGACQSAANAGFEPQSPVESHVAQIAYSETQEDSSSAAEKILKFKILNQAFADHRSLNLCPDSLNREQSSVGSKVYPVGQNQYLLQLECFQAAYQGNYAFAVAHVQSEQVQLTPLPLVLAGYPTYDATTQILSNAYKFRGVGDCVEESEYRWTGQELRLLTTQLVSHRPSSCEVFTGGESYRITPTRIGLARLGMTLSELKAELGNDAQFVPISLGVDMGMGIQVSRSGEVQFEMGAALGEPMTDSSIISMIRVSNPLYRTDAGVGPGTPLKQAIASYGPVTISLNLENESREYIKFARGIPSNMLIRSNQWALEGEAGVYSDPAASYRTTQNFKEKAAIGSLTITATP